MKCLNENGIVFFEEYVQAGGFSLGRFVLFWLLPIVSFFLLFS